MIMAADVAMVRLRGKNSAQALVRVPMRGIVLVRVLRDLARHDLVLVQRAPEADLRAVVNHSPSLVRQSLDALVHQAAANLLKASQKGVRDPAHSC
jgi:hypothetical protein